MLHTPDQTHQQTDAARLDYLIARLEDCTDPQRDLVLEHLSAARTFLLGAMPEEYDSNLRLASQAAATLSDERLQRDLKKSISSLSESVKLHRPQEDHPSAHRLHKPVTNAPPPSRESRALTEFFQDDGLSHGIFYPKNHVVAVFESPAQAHSAHDDLLKSGFADDEVLAVEGAEVLAFLSTLRQDTGLWGELMMELSRLLDTEATMVIRYEEWARKGAGFLVCYCAEENAAEQISRLLQPLSPIAAHWYMASFIRHLV